MFRAFIVAALFVIDSSLAVAATDKIPSCRLDDSPKQNVADTLVRAVSAYQAIGKPMPFETVHVNPRTNPMGERTLTVFIVVDAAKEGISEDGCASTPIDGTVVLDDLSVKGGCVVRAIENLEIRCSAEAVRIFAYGGQRYGRANPALLYVLSHELAHILQRRAGEYSGRALSLDLSKSQSSRLETLRDVCAPHSIKREEEADALAFKILAQLIAAAPYREPVLSERGSVLWNVDKLALASDAWQRAAAGREFISRPKLHPSFNPTEFPTPNKTVERNARRFVCDALNEEEGTILYPARSPSHPPVEQRLRGIAESLKTVAEALPDSGGQRDYKPIARLQHDLSSIFSHIYRETGVYMEKLDSNICTIVNAEAPHDVCR